ncbi:hypothetical protein [Tuwongella immobilis]|uniref:Uncharacterized protein n=1 Tax=Tuwongella immobilis TaxID=692036 RepID=A0A6C2YQ14_9BACT|nr:hypothetical protein [Tuwongella immobilis]VIP03484.1 Uncharacterized protein OS=Isosphaera pallida (strain ATCC 43644 / DSM 9630 / IS1B) GN=Isop_2497 PE=4 SV=1 [Tuwongella immobilis]VTS04338.1 Uncharacterized protein OS=Isosphaera pallida (strain ATCC 43644 / DSM 9630 / IS1B) GN=Isop_2497 PE=4 SV=1 [Tuwongella immobilis]
MTLMNRREMLTSAAGLTAVLTLPVDRLLAQGQLQYTPLELNQQGQQLLDPNVSNLDDHEENALNDLFNGNQNQEANDFRDLDQDINAILGNPGNPVGFNRDPFLQEGRGCQERIRFCLRMRDFRETTVMTVVQLIDSFVGHWYPCNDILEINHCETKIWNLLQDPRPDPRMLNVYLFHMQWELDSMFRYHRSNGMFQQHTTALLGLCGTLRQSVVARNFQGCRTDFVRFTVATSMVYKRYYPQWC